MIDNADRDKLKTFLSDQMNTHFALDYHEIYVWEGGEPIYVDFMNESSYEEVKHFEEMRLYMTDRLAKYNDQPKVVPMDLVLFNDAISHICRIYRVIKLKRGHMLCVGVGGSGRHSLTWLASCLHWDEIE